MTIEDSLSRVPEVYQPIYGHPELGLNSSRSCGDRWEVIKKVALSLEQLLGRPLRVLDLGCAQGFFSFHLAEMGAEVIGIDRLSENITLCNQLRSKYPNLNLKFCVADIENYITSLETGAIDLALGLSVFHHMCYEKGLDFVQTLMGKLSDVSSVCLIETALREEPLYWASSLPQIPRELMVEIAFVHRVSTHKTHLSEASRPLYFASQKIWFLGNSCTKFDKWKDQSHHVAGNVHENTRRYFFTPKQILKYFLIDGPLQELNLLELTKERKLLSSPPPRITKILPNIIEYGENQEAIWAVRDLVEGRLLSELIAEKEIYDPIQVIKKILHDLIVLEREGYYHTDLRTWNVVINREGEACLIDYGDICEKPIDVVSPKNIYISFFGFINDVLNKKIYPSPGRRGLFLNQASFVPPFSFVLSKLLENPPSKWSFELILKYLSATESHGLLSQKSPSVETLNLWISEIENILEEDHQSFTNFTRSVNNVLPSIKTSLETQKHMIEGLQAQIEHNLETQNHTIEGLQAQIEHNLETQKHTIGGLQAKIEHNLEYCKKIQVIVDTRESELRALYTSRSWRITAPFREFNLFIKRFLSWSRKRAAIFYNFPLRIVRRLLLLAFVYIRNRPEQKFKVKRLLSHFPILDMRLRNFFGTSRFQAGCTASSSCKPSALTPSFTKSRTNEAELPLSAPPVTLKGTGSRVLYYYVDHTVLCPVNTGMQRVTRRLGRALVEQGERIRFVKWDEKQEQLVLINQTDFLYLARWYGPLSSEDNLKPYPQLDDPPVFVPKHVDQAGNWLVIPEVTHINYQSRPLTLDIIMEAKSSGLKTAFIYYDALPLRRSELSGMSSKHETYMQQLLLADLVIPISDWSARDLLSFFHIHEKSSKASQPKITTIPLPGESQLAPRVTNPIPSDETPKVILSVGSIEVRKNQLSLVYAFEKYCVDYPDNDWNLVLVGSIHSDLAEEMKLALKRNKRIRYLDHISDEKLDELYRSCAFTVFPSLDEGFGLPILESLWYAKPCVCANFGVMADVAKGGGCLTVNVAEVNELVSGIVRMTSEPSLLDDLSLDAGNRPITQWSDYAKEFISTIDRESDPINKLGTVYYWVDQTCTYPGNSGIQRVVRSLARALLKIGVKLIPVKWDYATGQLCSPTDKELLHLAKWNGPDPYQWAPWIPLSASSVCDWLLIPELISGNNGLGGKEIKYFLSSYKMRGAWIFYDAIPWKMKDFYPPEVMKAHGQYMDELNHYELVFAISAHSRSDLLQFLTRNREKTPYLYDRIRSCPLPGEFLETSRVKKVKTGANSVIKMLCVSTIEPRKGHLNLLQAFVEVQAQSNRLVELTLVGGCPFNELADKVNHYTRTYPGIKWEKNVNDKRLNDLYLESDFTIYPSLEEGFGLPILESLWNARPCICRNFGAMAEVSEGGGCLAVETSDPDILAETILMLVRDDDLRDKLSREAVNREFKTWSDYAREVATHMAAERQISQQNSDEATVKFDEIQLYKQMPNLHPRPLLSICITTYNRAEWLALSLENLFHIITSPNTEIEIVVCDNASEDQTDEVVKPYLHRPDFFYYRNARNVGMLGNLRVTAHHARGQYIWILGDDDLVKPNSVKRILSILQKHSEISLVYMNYAYTREDDAKLVTDLESFLKKSTPILNPCEDSLAPVKQVSTKTENFFTAIYCLVFRRDHALRAYSQDTDGRPFSTMLTCIPTTYYVLNFMMEEPAYWVGDPQLVVNLNVSWMRYASIWILERLPEVHDLCEKMGASSQEVDRCRINHLSNIMYWFKEIFENDTESNIDYFSIARLLSRMKHLDEFVENINVLRDIYDKAHKNGHSGAKLPTSDVFSCVDNHKLI